MNIIKKRWFWLIIIFIIISLAIILFFYETNINFNNKVPSKNICGGFYFADDYRDDCDCNGTKTKPCEGIQGQVSCDGGTTYCIGKINQCYRIWSNNTNETIPCKKLINKE